MNTVEILKAARELLVTKGWTQLYAARDADGREADWPCPDAACFCSLGAVWKAASDTPYPAGTNAHKALSVAIGSGSVVRFNDTPGRTVEEVLTVFDKAIAAEEAKCAQAA